VQTILANDCIEVPWFFFLTAEQDFKAVVVAQLVERLLPVPEVRGSNPVIGKNLFIEHLFTVNCVLKRRK